MRFTPTPVANPVLTHGQARVAKDFRPAPDAKLETVARELTTPRPKAKAASPIAKVPDATLVFMLFNAAGRSADVQKCNDGVAQARKDFDKWILTQPDCADWRIAFRTWAVANAERFKLDARCSVQTPPPPMPEVMAPVPTPEVRAPTPPLSLSPSPSPAHWLTRLRRQPQAA